jgi:hypothetical protein
MGIDESDYIKAFSHLVNRKSYLEFDQKSYLFVKERYRTMTKNVKSANHFFGKRFHNVNIAHGSVSG